MNADIPDDACTACTACTDAGGALGASAPIAPCGPMANWLNSHCYCLSLKDGAIRDALQSQLDSPHLFALIEERCPTLFSASPIFISAAHMQRMAQLISAVESVVALPTYQQYVLHRASAVARHQPGAHGVFFGYDFHVHGDQVGLIEINTNAGGAMLNAVLARAQHACCDVMNELISSHAHAETFEARIVGMFEAEWQHAGRKTALRTIAIIDDAPEQQYLYPEFLLFQQLFKQHGYEALIADPAALRWQQGKLMLGERVVDLVYNRLTDFQLESQASAALREAYLADAVVLTPHPRAHALYADKRNLATLSHAETLTDLGVPAETQNILLAHIPATEIVAPQHAERLWANRRQLFFKPVAGYGGRAAYRGDKITKRVWEEILAGDYIAQALVMPGERVIEQGGQSHNLKFDIRQYVYEGQVQWTAARLYQGQTTNFRTPGGGFAPVYVRV